MNDNVTFDRSAILLLLNELGARLDARGVSAEFFIVGGSAMALAYDVRRLTRDIDGVFVPKTEVYAEAKRMAEERGLPAGWLNDGVKGLLPPVNIENESSVVHASKGVTVAVASPELLFAMKCISLRPLNDEDDVAFLAGLLSIRNAHDAVSMVERYYGDQVPIRTAFKLQELFDDSNFLSKIDDVALSSAPLSDARTATGLVRGYRKKDGTYVRPHRRSRR